MTVRGAFLGSDPLCRSEPSYDGRVAGESWSSATRVATGSHLVRLLMPAHGLTTSVELLAL